MMVNNRCISDRIQNYIEMFMDRIKYGFEYDVKASHYKKEVNQNYEEIFQYMVRRRWLPMVIEEEYEEFERMKKDILEFYFETVRGEMEYTNKNPRTVAAAILYRYLCGTFDNEKYMTERVLLKICETGSITNIKKMFPRYIEKNYRLVLRNGFASEGQEHNHRVSLPIYCTLSKDYWMYMKYYYDQQHFVGTV